MNLSPWDPWKEIAQLRTETDRLLDQFLKKMVWAGPEDQTIAFLPDVDFVESPSEYRLYISIPGFIEEDLELTLGEQSLIVRGERQPPYDSEHAQPRLCEWRYGFFERQFQFPGPIDSASIRAHCDAGVLTITIPKA